MVKSRKPTKKDHYFFNENKTINFKESRDTPRLKFV